MLQEYFSRRQQPTLDSLIFNKNDSMGSSPSKFRYLVQTWGAEYRWEIFIVNIWWSWWKFHTKHQNSMPREACEWDEVWAYVWSLRNLQLDFCSHEIQVKTRIKWLDIQCESYNHLHGLGFYDSQDWEIYAPLFRFCCLAYLHSLATAFALCIPSHSNSAGSSWNNSGVSLWCQTQTLIHYF